MPTTQQQSPFALSSRGRRTADQPISYLMAEALARPQLISLAAGFVDYDTLPDAATRAGELIASILADPATAKAALQYGTTQGDPQLREAILEHLAKLDGITTAELPGSADELVVTTGSQQLLHLITDALVDPGDIVLTAWPTYFVYTGALRAFGAEVRAIEMDEQGMIPQSLDEVLGELEASGDLSRVKILYVTSYHQNPTGLTLAEKRRPKLVELVRKYSEKLGRRILLIEDAAYRELTYEGESISSLKKFDTTGEYVALLQTFSKPFAPGFKTGYGLLPRDLVGPILLQKTGRDFGSSNLNQFVLNRVLRSGVFEQHLAALKRAYVKKRDAMLDALQQYLGDVPGVTWTKPTGGLYVWLTLPEAIDTGRHGPLFSEALEQGVLFVPGEYCYPPDPTRTVPRHTIRLSFGVADADAIRRGIERLAAAIHRCGA